MRFDMVVLKDKFSMSFQGSVYDPEQEPALADMVASMREGLEANGWEVRASVTHETKVQM